VGAPIVIGGRAAQSGDIVVGDINGVVVVPHAMIDHVLDQLETIKVAEKEMDAKVKAGLTTPPFIEHFINSKQLKEID
jgi:4-hydroxy-4-methyl-2-oxoglutarate aldolase